MPQISSCLENSDAAVRDTNAKSPRGLETIRPEKHGTSLCLTKLIPDLANWQRGRASRSPRERRRADLLKLVQPIQIQTPLELSRSGVKCRGLSYSCVVDLLTHPVLDQRFEVTATQPARISSSNQAFA